jgi:threonyl-tRNA synthetase
MDRQLWERSGHWDNYRDNMFTTESEKRDYAIKPMNCPGHVQIYNHGLHSYRDLPLRLAEFGSCHRNEPSGALHGLMRVRGFVQDDAHIFCTEDQIVAEVTAFNELLSRVYRDFGFTDVAVKLSLRPEKRAGSDEVWDKAEGGLREALAASGHQWEELPGEGAFYGPKIEYHVKDALGRSWQCGTMQLDFVLPERLDAEYVAEDNTRRRPVMLHRAILGSLERFIGILIENHAGALPMWLSPVQAVVLNISEAQADYVPKSSRRSARGASASRPICATRKLLIKYANIAYESCLTFSLSVTRRKQPMLLAVRARGNQDLGQMSLEEVVERWQREISTFAGTA